MRSSAAFARLQHLLTCSLCDKTLKDPRQLNCNHTFCRECILDYLAGAGQSQCPTCRVPAVNKDMARHFKFRDILELWQQRGAEQDLRQGSAHNGAETAILLADDDGSSASVATTSELAQSLVSTILPADRLSVKARRSFSRIESSASAVNLRFQHRHGKDETKDPVSNVAKRARKTSISKIYTGRAITTARDNSCGGSAEDPVRDGAGKSLARDDGISQDGDNLAAGSIKGSDAGDQSKLETQRLALRQAWPSNSTVGAQSDAIEKPACAEKADIQGLATAGAATAVQHSIGGNETKIEVQDEHVEATQQPAAVLVSPQVSTCLRDTGEWGGQLLVQETPEGEPRTYLGKNASQSSESDQAKLTTTTSSRCTRPTSMHTTARQMVDTPSAAQVDTTVTSEHIKRQLPDQSRTAGVHRVLQPRVDLGVHHCARQSPAVSTVRRPGHGLQQHSQRASPVRNFSLHTPGALAMPTTKMTTSASVTGDSSGVPNQSPSIANMFQWANGSEVKLSTDSLNFGRDFNMYQNNSSSELENVGASFRGHGQKRRRAGFAAPRPFDTVSLPAGVCDQVPAKSMQDEQVITLAPETQSSQGSDTHGPGPNESDVDTNGTKGIKECHTLAGAETGSSHTTSPLPVLQSELSKLPNCVHTSTDKLRLGTEVDEDSTHPVNLSMVVDANPRPQDVVVMLSGIEDERVERYRKIVQQRGGTLLSSDGDNFLHVATSHLVTCPRERRGQSTNTAKRTLKYFAAVLRGNWIVNENWLLSSGSEWSNEERFELDGDSKCTGTPRNARLAMVQNGSGLFADFCVCLHGSFRMPSRSQLEALINIGGGTCCANPHSTVQHGKQLIVICDDPGAAKALHYMTPVKTSWLLESISNFRPLVPLQLHPKLWTTGGK